MSWEAWGDDDPNECEQCVELTAQLDIACGAWREQVARYDELYYIARRLFVLAALELVVIVILAVR